MRVLPDLPVHRGEGCPTARQLVAPPLPDDLPGTQGSGRVPAVHAEPKGLNDFKQWTSEAQERALELIQQRQINPWRPFYCPKPHCDGNPHDDWTWQHGRFDQRPPPMDDPWLTWLLLGGRGGGKTRAGSEAIHRIARLVPRIHLIAPTGPDLRDTMVEGDSGLQATAPPDFIPQWEPSKKRLTWPNGAIALGFSGEEPDRLRGPQCYLTWIDEPALMPLIDGDNGVWNNMLFGLRLGKQIGWRPRVIATTTPKPVKWMRELVAAPTTKINKFSSYANINNLADTYKEQVLARFEGTRLGKQELHGDILTDVAGSLWKDDWFQYITEPELALLHFDRIYVGIDPAGTANRKSDETGIIAVGIIGKTIYVLDDKTGKYTPAGWANAAVAMYHKWSADSLVAEKNYGGDMVREVLEKNGAEDIKIIEVTSRRGKAIRAEPIAALYEKGAPQDQATRVYHRRLVLEDLETELTTWVPGRSDSPNRLDALVHAITKIGKEIMPTEMASASDVLRGRRVKGRRSAA